MDEYRRNLYILGSFVACMVVAVGVYLWSQLSAPPDQPESGILSSSLHPLDMPPIQPPKLERRYQGIVERDFFKPLEGEIPMESEPESPEAEEQAVATAAGRSGSSVVYGPASFPDLYAPIPGVPSYGPSATFPPLDWSSPSMMPPEPPAPMEPAPGAELEQPARPAGPPAATVAVTAVVRGGDGRARVLVEDNATGETKWVEPGARAFGYKVDYATEKGGVLSREGRQYVVGVGENKPTAPAAEPTPPDEATTPPTAEPSATTERDESA